MVVGGRRGRGCPCPRRRRQPTGLGAPAGGLPAGGLPNGGLPAGGAGREADDAPACFDALELPLIPGHGPGGL